MKRKKNIQIKNKELWSKQEKCGLMIAGLVFLLIIIVFSSVPIFKESENQKILEDLMNKEIPFQKVCAVSNEIKFVELNPVIIENKTYWVCCSSCKAKLVSNGNVVRFTIDPYSKAKLNKADAIAFQNPKKKGKVLFFESIKNYEKYMAENIIE